MTSVRSHFSTYVPIEGSELYMGNGTVAKVVGVGTVRIRLQHGRSWTLTGVKHVPDVRRSLISVGALTGAGCSLAFGGSKLRVSRGGRFLMTAKKIGNLYVLHGCQTIGGEAHNAPSSGDGAKAIEARKRERLRHGRVAGDNRYFHAGTTSGTAWMQRGQGAKKIYKKVEASSSATAMPKAKLVEQPEYVEFSSVVPYGMLISKGVELATSEVDAHTSSDAETKDGDSDQGRDGAAMAALEVDVQSSAGSVDVTCVVPTSPKVESPVADICSDGEDGASAVKRLVQGFELKALSSSPLKER